MTESRRRPHGEGSVYWDTARQRYVAEMTVGFDARGKRIRRKGSGTTEAAALRAMRKRVRDHQSGLAPRSELYTVQQAVWDWLEYGNPNVDAATARKHHDLCEVHILPNLGGRRLRDLTAEEVDRWLHSLTSRLSTRSIAEVRSCLGRSIRRAMARGYVERNVVELAETPRGLAGRPSKSLTVEQARAVLARTVDDKMHAYIVMSILTGARTEELRALRWDHVHLDTDTTAAAPVPPHVEVWRSVRATGDTKTRMSRRTLALPAMAVDVLRRYRETHAGTQPEPGTSAGLVFATSTGQPLNAANVRRDFRRALSLVPDLDPAEWTPREMRHSFVSVLSESGLHIDEIALLVGHAGGSQVTERVYRKQLRPVIQTGATAMDKLFGDHNQNRAHDA